MEKNNDKNMKMSLQSELTESRRNNLLLKYKPLIKPGKNKIQDIENFLIKHFSAFRIDFTQLSNGFQNHVLYNIINLINEHELNISVSNMDILVYILPENENTKDYYSHLYTPVKVRQNASKDIQEKICIILEPATEYIECGCAKLFLEIELKLGVSQYDYDNNTDELFCYISTYKSYYDKKYL